MEDLKLKLLDNILNYQVPTISKDVHFWMIRAQQGFFYNEFITNGYVALAWNAITCSSSFSSENKETLTQLIKESYPSIKNTGAVINKCEKFIFQMKVGDIVIIPGSHGNSFTLAYAGEYFEEPTFTIEDENRTILTLDDSKTSVKCPYKKRRYIEIIKTVPRSYLTPALQRAVSSYHGISNLDDYAIDILSVLYNCFIYNDTFALVFFVKKQNPIKPKELINLMYSCTNVLSTFINEDGLSTKLNLNSPGPISFLTNTFNFFKDNWYHILAILILLTGGQLGSIKFNGIIPALKSLFDSKQDKELKKLEIEEKKVNIKLKEFELAEKKKKAFQDEIASLNISPDAFFSNLETFYNSINSMEIETIANCAVPDSYTIPQNNESPDTNEVQ